MNGRQGRCGRIITSAESGAVPDQGRDKQLGLSLSQVDQTLYDAFGERQVTTVYTSSRQYKVILELQPQFQNDPSALSRVYLTSPSGARIPLNAVAQIGHKVESTSFSASCMKATSIRSPSCRRCPRRASAR